MAKRLDVDKLLADNPKASREAVSAALEAVAKIKENGIQRRGYELEPPFGSAPSRVQGKK